MVRSEEVKRPLQEPVQLPQLQVRLQHVNDIDCSCGAVVARWRGMGILSSSRLGRLSGLDLSLVCGLGRKLVVENNVQKRAMDLQPAIVMNEAQFPEFVHEMADP
jgi:hypothetical protein